MNTLDEQFPWVAWVRLFLESATFIALVVYVVKTWTMASATREAVKVSADSYREAVEARAEALAPRVLIYLVPEVSLLRLTVENAGQGTAADVVFAFDPPLGTTHPRLKPIFFDSPQALLPSGYKLVHTVDSWPSFLKSDLPKRYDVVIRYRGVENNRQYTVKYVLDMEAFRNLYVPDRKDIHDIAVTLDKLTESVARKSGDLLSRLDDGQSDILLAVSRSDSRPFPVVLADMRALWGLLSDSTSNHTHFVDRKALARRIRADAVSLCLAASRDIQYTSSVSHASALAMAFLDEREAGYLTDEWQAEVTGLLQRLTERPGAPPEPPTHDET